MERAAGLTSVTGAPFVWAIVGAVDARWAIAVLSPPPRWRDAGALLAVGVV